MDDLIDKARAGDLDAYGRLVELTQPMVYGVARTILRDASLAQDATQEAYLRAFQRLGTLQQASGFVSWLRRIVANVALNMHRARRTTLLRLDELPEVPILDEAETTWSEQQRERLAAALLTLSVEERRVCDRRYHGGWNVARLARDSRVPEAVMRKRLQRIRDKLRKEIEMTEQRDVRPDELRPELPKRIVELLARPVLIDLPDNPVGKVLESIREVYADFREVALPEVVDIGSARTSAVNEAIYVDATELHRVDDTRILRYDLTLPLLLTLRYSGQGLKAWAAGKAYRLGRIDATHLDAFHQAEAFWLDTRDRVDPWQMTARVVQSIDRLLPGRPLKMVPTAYPMCSQAWELEVQSNDRWSEVLAWGVFTDKIVRHLGADPATHAAVGVGYGLERIAMLCYGIDDIRKIDVASVA